MFQKLYVPRIIDYIKIFQTYSDDCQSILDKEVEDEGDNTNEWKDGYPNIFSGFRSI